MCLTSYSACSLSRHPEVVKKILQTPTYDWKHRILERVSSSIFWWTGGQTKVTTFSDWDDITPFDGSQPLIKNFLKISFKGGVRRDGLDWKICKLKTNVPVHSAKGHWKLNKFTCTLTWFKLRKGSRPPVLTGQMIFAAVGNSLRWVEYFEYLRRPSRLFLRGRYHASIAYCFTRKKTARVEFCSEWAILSRIANLCTRWRVRFEWLSRPVGWNNPAESLGAS
jgi:hypothetical protein